MLKKKQSLESEIKRLLAGLVLLIMLPIGFIIFDFELAMLESFTVILFFSLPACWLCLRLYFRIKDLLQRVGLQLDSIGNEEFNISHLDKYQSGLVDSLKQDFANLAKRLASKQLETLHNESFLFEFIKSLGLPILVMDHHQQIYLTNHAFNQIIDGDPALLLGQKVAHLGLENIDNQWQQVESSSTAKSTTQSRRLSIIAQRYEITSHLLKKSGRDYQFLVFFSVEKRLRENEKQVWYRLIRVLNHEVRNSLTPIYSMSQSLQQMHHDNIGPLTDEQAAQQNTILQVIENRAQQLLEFVESYSAFSELATPVMRSQTISAINQRIAAIFPRLVIEFEDDFSITIDIGQFEQALINLIKNAFEASDIDAAVKLQWQFYNQYTQIEIIDSGQGITNQENLFVPFYSTKQNGTGIGLILSRELIRNQGGELILTNRPEAAGCIARIRLPN